MTTGSRDADAAGNGRILLSFGNDRHLRRLREVLDRTSYAVTAVDPDEGVGDAEFDLCITDASGFRRLRPSLSDRQAAEHPRHLPCLLVAAESGGAGRSAGRGLLAQLDRGEELVDGVLSTPVRGAELRRRVESLLRTRRLSRALGDRTTQYRRLVELTPEAVLVVGDGEILHANGTGQQLLSEVAPDRSGADETLSSLVVPDHRDRFRETLRSIRAGDPPREYVPVELSGEGGSTLVEVAGARISYGGRTAVQLIVREVGDRHATDPALPLYRQAMDQASLGVTIADATRPDDPIVYANAAFERITGYTVPEVLGRNLRLLQGEDTDEDAVETIATALEEDRHVRTVVRNYRKNGTPFWNEMELTPVRDASGEVTHYLGFQRDVTDRVERGRELQALHGATRQLLRAGDVNEVSNVTVETAEEVLGLPATAVYLHDPDGDRLVPAASTPSTRELIGNLPVFDRGEGIAWDVFESGETTVVDDVRGDDRTYNPDTPVEAELLVPLGDHGVLLTGSVEGGAFDDADVQFARTLGMSATAALDRADREQELRRRERELQRYETIVLAAGEPIFTMDADHRFVDVNQALVELTGYSRNRLIGEHASIVLGEDAIERQRETIRALLSGEASGSHTQEVVFETAAGDERRCLLSIALLPFEDEYRGTVGVVRDITRRHRRAQRLEVMDRVLRHNLRNEMNIVRGRAAALEPLVDEDSLEHVEEIQRAADALLSLSDGARRFHDAFHDEGGKVATVDLVPEVESAVDGLDARFPAAEIHTDLPDEAKVRAHEAVRIPVEELVENAVVHNDRERPSVEVRITERDDQVLLLVADDGPGIPEMERQTIEEGPESALEHASGLGLWLVSWIAESSGAVLECEDGDPRGTVVTIRFPPGEG